MEWTLCLRYSTPERAEGQSEPHQEPGCGKWTDRHQRRRPPQHLFKCSERPGKALGIGIPAWFPPEARQPVAWSLEGKLSLRQKRSSPKPEASSLFHVEVTGNPGRSLLLISYGYYRPPSSLMIRQVNRENVQAASGFRDQPIRPPSKTIFRCAVISCSIFRLYEQNRTIICRAGRASRRHG